MTYANQALTGLTASQAANLLRSGELTAVEYAEALIEQAEKIASLNAFISFDADAVRTQARAADDRRRAGERLGPLHGIPLAIKDNIDTADLPTTAGTPGLRHHRPRNNALVVQRLLDAGAILFGKNNLHELAYGVTTNNRAFGASRNPYDLQRVPGGSSGGTAAAVCARVVPAGIGTDTGASIRLPMAFCGGVGFRPSVGRWPQQGLIPASNT
ncbi:MAG: amidase family protein, partial [Steroidobacteraceae bacterium]